MVALNVRPYLTRYTSWAFLGRVHTRACDEEGNVFVFLLDSPGEAKTK